ncbi:hypothetical protein GNI_024590 [Gregarina niphandrodes]|uniref:Uncharacterized protein n=1 Tax=Gregarina niphandrodes TaxID=110365 RepID=A0A023BBG5_GRENI|nr:hypothetical protein GNI_024590 [Gregarina niphandrodes]EZG79708.1 hypothetical protein GNI_024590 [Gregarina niphandrodes]|eukprot:XP_011134390.1 hypothetical protein GNI_024590 [Gregarina niphandrodes]
MSCWIENGSKLMRCLHYYNIPSPIGRVSGGSVGIGVGMGGLELRRRCSILCSLLSFVKEYMGSNEVNEFEMMMLTQTQCIVLSNTGIIMLKTSKALRLRLIQDQLIDEEEEEDEEDEATSTSGDHSYGTALSYYRSLVRVTEKNRCCKVISWLGKLVATEAGLITGAGDSVGILALATLSVVQTTFPFPGLTCNVYEHKVLHNNDSVEIAIQSNTNGPTFAAGGTGGGHHARTIGAGRQLSSIYDDSCILPLHSVGIFAAYRSMVLDAKMEGVCLSGDIQTIQPLLNMIKPTFKALIPLLPSTDSAREPVSRSLGTRSIHALEDDSRSMSLSDNTTRHFAQHAARHHDTSRWDTSVRPIAPNPQELALIMLEYFGGNLSTYLTVDAGYDTQRLPKPRGTDETKGSTRPHGRGSEASAAGDSLFKLPTKRQSRLSLTNDRVSGISTIEDTLPTSVKRNMIMVGPKRILLVGSNRHVGELRSKAVHGGLIRWATGFEATGSGPIGSAATGSVARGSGGDEVGVGIPLIEFFSLLNLTRSNVIGGQSHMPNEFQTWLRTRIDMFVFSDFLTEDCCDWLLLHRTSRKRNSNGEQMRLARDSSKSGHEAVAEDQDARNQDQGTRGQGTGGQGTGGQGTGGQGTGKRDSLKDAGDKEARSEPSVTYSFTLRYMRQLLDLQEDSAFSSRVRTTQWLLDLLEIFHGQRLDHERLPRYLTELPLNSCYKSELHFPSPVEQFSKPPKTIYVMPLPTKQDTWHRPTAMLIPSASAASRLVNSPTYNVLNNCSYAAHILNQLVRLPASQIPASQLPASQLLPSSQETQTVCPITSPTTMLESTDVTLIGILPKGIPSNEPVDRRACSTPENGTQERGPGLGSTEEDAWEQVQDAICTDYNTLREQLDDQVQLVLVSYFWLEDSYCAGAPLDPSPYRVKIAYGSTFQLVDPKGIDFTNSLQDIGDEPKSPTPAGEQDSVRPEDGDGSSDDDCSEGGGCGDDIFGDDASVDDCPSDGSSEDHSSDEDCSDEKCSSDGSSEDHSSDVSSEENKGRGGLKERRGQCRYSLAGGDRSKRLRL